MFPALSGGHHKTTKQTPAAPVAVPAREHTKLPLVVRVSGGGVLC
jgi:hypothetical protein